MSELLAPAGDLEKLKIAIDYGADAVYLGGSLLGLRAKAKNFDFSEMEQGIAYAHSYNKKVYITVNIYAHNDDFHNIEDYLLSLKNLGADAIIVADPGIFSVARNIVPDLDIHISTQANTTNYHSVSFWQQLGAKRVVLARELSLSEIKATVNNSSMQIEAFVHGAMCISYSGRCLLSNYLTHRDANRGECSHPCRWSYALVEKTRPNESFPIVEDERGTYILNSKDLCMIQHIPDLVDAGISSFKIEGRMKTSYYVAAVVKAYRDAIDDYFSDAELYERKKHIYLDEIKKTSYRDFTTGFYYDKPGSDEQNYGDSSYIRSYDFVGLVLDYDQDSHIATVEQRNKFVLGDTIEVLKKSGEGFSQVVTEMYDQNYVPIQSAPHAKQIILLKLENEVCKHDMLRKRAEDVNY